MLYNIVTVAQYCDAVKIVNYITLYTWVVIFQERQSIEIGRQEALRECEVLKERLDSSQRAWNATTRELEEKTRVYSSLDHELRCVDDVIIIHFSWCF